MQKDPFAEREAEKYSNPIPSREYILDIFTSIGSPLKFNQLKKELALNGEQKEAALRKRLRAMVRDGQLDKIHKSYCLKGFLNKSRKIDWSLEVSNKVTKKTAGKLIQINNFNYVIPFLSKEISQDILIPVGNEGEAKINDGVIVEVIMPVFKWADPIGKVLKVLGNADDRSVIISMAIACLDIPVAFPSEIKKYLLNNAEIFDVNNARKSRVDLTSLPFVTIDGEDAKDFDDAVFCQKNPQRGWDLYVAIADVSYYVLQDSILDKHALLRGNSVYLPGKVIPMLPELLSNELCSLKPNTDKLTIVCQMHINNSGKLTKYTFYEAVICSKARLTYNKVADVLQNNKNIKYFDTQVLYNLTALKNVFMILQQQRQERGAIEFESTESKMSFNQAGEVIDIQPIKRNIAHKIIEECMLCANVATAKLLQKHKLLSIYRIHEGPTATKLGDLKAFLKSVGLSLEHSDNPTSKDYAGLLQNISHRKDADVIQMILLRSMCQAIYSANNIGHFGLAYSAYTHFTSPIRRYTDLLVHRHIKAILNNSINDMQLSVEYINNIAEHCSITERRADDASREVIKACKCKYLKNYIGHKFVGIVSGVTKFGLFVELKDLYMDGLIHINSLGSDYFIHDPISHKLIGEKSGLIYALGMEINVIVSKVDLDRRRIDFVLDQPKPKAITKINKNKLNKSKAKRKTKKQQARKNISGKKK